MSLIMNDIDVKRIRQELGLTQANFAKMLGVNPRTVQNWEAGGVIPESKCELLRNIKEGNVSPSGTQDGAPGSNKRIPLYDTVATIGGVNEMAAVNGVAAPTSTIDAGDWFRDATAAIKHYGESMIEYPPGCTLVIKEVLNRDLIVPGCNYVIETSEYRVTKRLQLGDDNTFRAYSTNTETYADGKLVHEPFNIPKVEIRRMFLVLGYVVKTNGGSVFFPKPNP